MTALASSLKRLWSATSRLPRLTGRGTAGFISKQQSVASICQLLEKLPALLALARRTAPSIVILALNIFR